ncbi:hypothetical protein HXX76_001114 [Chlamydomonas incerta]|uniref:Uncharacterized protein n=1 Tax=Chlamydomonas incerta TaxID=51695 RepID=A0A835WBQ2_CHLIN|nr:hypothetical protein HXX76_001114 [Chlamydomonas incerta]|eukprot:KAG2444358.1 hypothetical protein HXX76_001114 [Chlamydomonas incerta]
MVVRALLRASNAATQPLAQWPAAASQLAGLGDGLSWPGLSGCQGRTGCARGLSSPALSSPCPGGPPAFSFDIDGVLIRGKHVLPEALEAVKKLTTADGRWRYPVVFMTNGGGVCEERKAAQLSGWLGVQVAPSQVILAHTPMRDLAPQLAAAPVLVSGRGDVLAVARRYGLGRALHTRQLGRAMPAATPFSAYPPPAPKAEAAEAAVAAPAAAGPGVGAGVGPVPASAASAAPPGPAAAPAAGPGPEPNITAAAAAAQFAEPCPVVHQGLATEQAPIHTVLVMTDPDDWYRDAQLICDVLSGGGVPARSPAAAAAAGAAPVRLVFSNPDLLWANEFPKNRFGQGAFAHMVLSLYSRLTGGGRPPHVTFYGKPNPQPYRLAERLLLAQARELGLELPEAPPGALPFSAIYGVGDNPAADVRGANQAGAPWVSVLVRTGVFQGPGPNCDIDTARIAVDDVAAGVEAALHHTRSLRWHSMR